MRFVGKIAETDPSLALILHSDQKWLQRCAKDLILVFNSSRATAYRDIDELLKLRLLCCVGQGKAEYDTTLSCHTCGE